MVMKIKARKGENKMNKRERKEGNEMKTIEMERWGGKQESGGIYNRN